MTTLVIVIDKVTGQFQVSFRRCLVVTQIHILILNRSPQTLNHDVIKRMPDAVHADGNPGICQTCGKQFTRKLTALVCVEDFRVTAGLCTACQWRLIRIAAETQVLHCTG